MATVSTFEVEVGGQRLSGRAAEPDGRARAIVFALHGGSYSSRYYDLRAASRASALQNYASLGYRVIALDRPGYGAADDIAPEAAGFTAQADALRAAVVQLHGDRGEGLPVFLIGHSIGGMIAMMVAGGDVAAPLRGVMASGMGMVWQPGILEMWSSLISEDSHVPVPNEARDQIMFAAEPALVDPAVQREAGRRGSPSRPRNYAARSPWHK